MVAGNKWPISIRNLESPASATHLRFCVVLRAMPSPSPDVNAQLEELVKRNVETIAKLEQAMLGQRTRGDMFADAIAQFCGSMAFVYVHIFVLGGWIFWNLFAAIRFDPPPFTMMNSMVAIEAIFLTTFVLISQNRQQKIADRRNLLDLQINMLAEQENSQMLSMLQALLRYHGLNAKNPEVEALQQMTDPEVLASHIDQSMEEADDSEEKE
jgi:uncharacterized membrane protein